MTGWPPGSPNLPPPLTGGPHLVGSLSSLGQRCRGIPMENTVQAPLKIVAVSSQCRGRDHSRQGVLSVQHRHGVQMPIKLNPGDDRADPGMQPRCVASRGGGETCRYRTGGSGHHHEGRVDQGWQRRPLLLLQVKKTILILWLQRGLMAVAAVEGLPEDQSWSQPGRALKPIVQAIVQVPALQGFSRAPQTLGLGRRGVVDSGLQPQLACTALPASLCLRPACPGGQVIAILFGQDPGRRVDPKECAAQARVLAQPGAWHCNSALWWRVPGMQCPNGTWALSLQGSWLPTSPCKARDCPGSGCKRQSLWCQCRGLAWQPLAHRQHHYCPRSGYSHVFTGPASSLLHHQPMPFFLCCTLQDS